MKLDTLESIVNFCWNAPKEAELHANALRNQAGGRLYSTIEQNSANMDEYSAIMKCLDLIHHHKIGSQVTAESNRDKSLNELIKAKLKG